MTVPVNAEFSARLPWYRQSTARLGVGVARILVLLPPNRLCAVLRRVSARARPASYEQAARARRAAVAVSSRCAGMGCVQRSVATVLICRARGRWPDWCTGFRTEPFAAHAWVEVDGVPVDEPEGIRIFQTILSVRYGRRDGS